jgi:thymidylate kinase
LVLDKFLRPTGTEATPVTRALDVVADLYYLDEHAIGPALSSGLVVLKDRHIDTIFSTLIPTLAKHATFHSEARALIWLNALMSELQHRPDLTVYVDAPQETRLKRIRGRTRPVVEDRAHEVNREDIAVFAERDRLMRTAIEAEPTRFLVMDNDSRPVEQAAEDVLSWINAQQAQNS